MSTIIVELQHQLQQFRLNVAFTTPTQGITALFGPSGCGKTSVLRAIAGLIRCQQGKVQIGDLLWQNSKCFIPTHKRQLGYVFQEASLFTHLSVVDNLLYGWNRIPEQDRRISFESVVDLLGIAPLLHRSTHQLSGGERQRVAIGRALLTSPQILLMDEPLSALDHQAKQSILPYLEQLHDELAIPSIYVSHDPNEVARLSNHLILMERGEVIASGYTNDLLTRLDLPLSNIDNSVALLEGIVSAHDSTFHLTWISMHGGRVAISREDLPVGKRARIEIQARDVSLSLHAHSDTSIINILPVTIYQIHELNQSQLLVSLKLQDGQKMLSKITRRSAYSLELHIGLQLYAQVKSVAYSAMLP